MLAAIGADSIDELFADFPTSVRLGRALELPDGLVGDRGLRPARARWRRATPTPSRRSASSAPGCTTTTCRRSSTRSPQRSEFLTPYTPYQPEISQGGLQAMFEFQTAISELTGLPVSNASLYEGPSSVASAAYLAIGATKGRRQLVVSRGSASAQPRDARDLRAPASAPRWSRSALEGGRHRRRRARRGGRRRDRRGLRPEPELPRRGRGPRGARRRRRRRRARSRVAAVDPISLGVLRPPGECGVDVAVGEGQPLGNRLDFGGPSFGFFAATEEHLRRMPGRIAGETERRRRPPRLRARAADPRAAHPPREGDPQHLHLAGAERARRRDLPALARQAGLRGARRAAGAAHRLRARAARARSTGVELLHEAPVVREFAVRLDAPVERGARRAARPTGSRPGIRSAGSTRSTRTALLVAITERRSRGGHRPPGGVARRRHQRRRATLFRG